MNGSSLNICECIIMIEIRLSCTHDNSAGIRFRIELSIKDSHLKGAQWINDDDERDHIFIIFSQVIIIYIEYFYPSYVLSSRHEHLILLFTKKRHISLLYQSFLSSQHQTQNADKIREKTKTEYYVQHEKFCISSGTKCNWSSFISWLRRTF